MAIKTAKSYEGLLEGNEKKEEYKDYLKVIDYMKDDARMMLKALESQAGEALQLSTVKETPASQFGTSLNFLSKKPMFAKEHALTVKLGLAGFSVKQKSDQGKPSVIIAKRDKESSSFKIEFDEKSNALKCEGENTKLTFQHTDELITYIRNAENAILSQLASEDIYCSAYNDGEFTISRIGTEELDEPCIVSVELDDYNNAVNYHVTAKQQDLTDIDDLKNFIMTQPHHSLPPT